MTSPEFASRAEQSPPEAPKAGAARGGVNGAAIEPKPRRWLAVVVAAWCVALAVGAGWAVVNGVPTAREQTTVAAALPVMDQAATVITAAATVDGRAITALEGLSQTECSVTAARDGLRLRRTVSAFVTPGTEAALLERVAARLPRAYHAVVRTGAAARLNADAGLYVAVGASVTAPGEVRFIIDSGNCRAPGELPALADAVPSQAQRVAVQGVLGRLGASASNWQLFRASCAGGDGSLTTVWARTAKGSAPAGLDERLATPAGSVAVRTPDLVAWRDGNAGVVARAVDGALVVTATTICPK